MNEGTKTGLEILSTAVLLGILGDVLLRAEPWGLNIFLFVGALVAAMVMLVRRRRPEFWNVQTLALQGALLFFGAMYVWRDSSELRVFNTLAILAILAILTLPALKISRQVAGVFHYFLGFVWSGISAAFAPLMLLFEDIRWTTAPRTGWSKHLISVLRGVLIVAPLLLIFGALFAAADAAFQQIVERAFNFEVELFVEHLLVIGFISWSMAGYLRGSLAVSFAEAFPESSGPADGEKPAPQVLSVTEIKDDEAPKTEEKPKEPEKKSWQWQNLDNSILPGYCTLGGVEISIVLGLVNLLFLGFVVLQIPYLFGGMDLVQNTPDFKLAEYARRGFGELVAVAALVLPILLFTHWLLRRDDPANEKIYRVLAAIQIVLLFVIMLSAAQRLFLLTGNLGYGLTTARFYPMIFMIWLALVFVWFAVTVLRGSREHFAWGALWLALFMTGALHVLNPDDYIVRTNVRLMQEGRSFDAAYNAGLSDDAVPALVELLPQMSREYQCSVKSRLSNRVARFEKETDFRTLNISRWSARRLLNENKESLLTGDCPPDTTY